MGAINFWRKKTDLVWSGSAGQLIKGVFNATTAGYGLKLTTARTWIERGNADDGGAVISGSGAAYLFGSRRLLLTAAQTGNNSWYGGCDRVEVNSDCSAVTGHVAGHWGYLEMKASSKVNVAGAVRGQIDCPSTAVVGTLAGAFMAASNDLSGTHTGPICAMAVTTPVAGSWDGLVGIQSTECVVTSFTGNTTFAANSKGSFTQVGQIKIYVGGSLYYIPYGTVA